MIREQTLRARQKLVSKLPISGELLRGSLLERTVRHTKDCPKCARGEGHLGNGLGRHQRAWRALLVGSKGCTSIAGSRSIQTRKSSASTSVRRARLTARSSPDLIASYSAVRPVHATVQACATV